MRIDDLLDEILMTVEKGINLKLFHRTILEGDRIVSTVEEIRANYPDDLIAAEKITANRNRILDSAEKYAKEQKDAAVKEADSIVAGAGAKAEGIVNEAKAAAEEIIRSAQLRAEQLISESNITKTANERATQLLAETNNDCENMLNGTKADCDEMRQQAEEWSTDLKRDAYNYAMHMVGEIDSFLSASTSDLRTTKNNLENM